MDCPYTLPKLAETPLPDLLTLVAQQNSQRPLVQIIRGPSDGPPTDCIRLCWAEVLQHAQNAAANLRNRWSASHRSENAHEPIVQPREPGSPTVVVGVLGSTGYKLYVNVLACVLNRWTVLLLSPKNSLAGTEHLLRTSNCSLFLVEPIWNLEFGRTMKHAIPRLTVQTIVAFDPPVTGPATSPVISPAEHEQLKREMETPAFHLHTSGSTGHPKLIPWSHEFVLTGIRGRRRDKDKWIGLPLYSLPPVIHAMGMIMYFGWTLAHGLLINFVETPTPKPPSAASLLSHLPFIQRGIILVPPSILDDLYSLGPEAVKEVANGTRLVLFAGASLNATTGNALVAAGMELTAGYGATEIHATNTHIKEKKPEDWEYVHFSEGYDIHLLPIDNHSNLRELIVGAGEDGSPAVIDHENPRGFATKDIFEPHPTVPDLWKLHSRKGDITVLSNGEKSNNRQIQSLLLQDKRILHVLVFGAGRPMNGVVIQPADPSVLPSEFVAQIHPTIVHANSVLPKHSRLLPELIIIAGPDRLFAMTEKGTFKKETLDLFLEEIQSAYDALERNSEGMEWKSTGSISEKNDMKIFVQSAVLSVLGKEISDDADFFEHGLDSLLSMRLRMAVLSVVKNIPTASQSVPRDIVYTFPTINALTTYLMSLSEPEVSNPEGTIEGRVRRSILKYSANLVPHKSGSRVPQGKLIALSGSTGSVGSSILNILLGMEDVGKVYLLNRIGSETQETRQVTGFKKRGLDPKILEAKKGRIVYLNVDFSRNDLGLSDVDYAELRDNVTHIIHAAWQLNLNLILESYERVHIVGVRHLVDLALSSPHSQPPRITFLSTIAAAALYQGPTREPSVGERAGQALVPEAPIDDPAITLDQGYGHSKYVGERVLVNAVVAGLRATIIRVGQLSGATTNGAWAVNEHVPIMLRSSLALGLVPEDLPAVRWTPSDVAASAILKQALEDGSPLEYFSIENPFPTPWNIVVQALSAVSPKPLRTVSLAAWLEHIRMSNPDPRQVPATKLLAFYQGIAQGGLSTAALAWEKSVKFAPELATGPISTQLIQKYVVYQQEKIREL